MVKYYLDILGQAAGWDRSGLDRAAVKAAVGGDGTWIASVRWKTSWIWKTGWFPASICRRMTATIPLRSAGARDYIGQEKVKENLSVFIDAAKQRHEALDHVLLYGPPGLGKTTLAAIIANELGVNFRITSGPALERPGDLGSHADQYGRGRCALY